ncbi:MAG: Ca2+/Na+ antiporter [Rhodothermales bacterium]|jgi:Ca2+/Na+ antiporter
MSTKILMSVSAAVLAALGLATLFAPLEVASLAGLQPSTEIPLQLLAGGFFAFGMLNWMGRGAIYGGIYGRPMVMANVALGLVTSTTLVSAVLDGKLGAWAWVVAAIFGLQTLAFGRLMFSSPKPANP